LVVHAGLLHAPEQQIWPARQLVHVAVHALQLVHVSPEQGIWHEPDGGYVQSSSPEQYGWGHEVVFTPQLATGPVQHTPMLYPSVQTLEPTVCPAQLAMSEQPFIPLHSAWQTPSPKVQSA